MPLGMSAGPFGIRFILDMHLLHTELITSWNDDLFLELDAEWPLHFRKDSVPALLSHFRNRVPRLKLKGEQSRVEYFSSPLRNRPAVAAAAGVKLIEQFLHCSF